MTGTYIVVEGPDGSGKSLFTDTALAWSKKNGKRVLNLRDFWSEHERHPHPEELDDYDVLVLYEPTGIWTGKQIREELVQKNRGYSGHEIAHAFSTDRVPLFKRVIRPALEKNMIVFSDRSFATSVVFQPAMDDTITLEQLLDLPGHKLALGTPADHILIMLVDPDEAMNRIGGRVKQDNAVFEKKESIARFNERYRSDWFKQLFENNNTKLHYIDTTPISIEESRAILDKLLKQILDS